MTPDEARAAMTARAAIRPTPLLCSALDLLDATRSPDQAERLTRAVLIDVLCERHPEADAAFTAWADSVDTNMRNAVPVITAAARKAVQSAAVTEKT